MPSNHPIICCPFLLLPSIFPSIRDFFNESVLHTRWSKYWSFSISPSSEYSGLISFRIDCFHLLEVQDSQEFSPAPQFESINSSALSFLLYGADILRSLLTEPCAGLVLPVMGWEWLPDSGVQTWKTHLPRDTRHTSLNRLLYLPSALPICLISQLIQTQEERGY